jgi:DNA-binding transcriptional regulator GbsR (MarR family)
MELENEKEDWDIDFTRYEREDQEESNTIVLEQKPGAIDIFRSKFSNGLKEMERLHEIGILISKYSIKIASRTPDRNDISKYYGLLDEFWASIKYIFGKKTQDKINTLMKECKKMIFESNGKIDQEVYSKLLSLRNKLYKIKQYSNLGLEVEKKSNSSMQKVKQSIVQ